MKQPTHKKGEIVTIKNCDLEGNSIIEGQAELVSFLGYNDRTHRFEFWKVRFSDGYLVNRFIEKRS